MFFFVSPPQQKEQININPVYSSESHGLGPTMAVPGLTLTTFFTSIEHLSSSSGELLLIVHLFPCTHPIRRETQLKKHQE